MAELLDMEGTPHKTEVEVAIQGITRSQDAGYDSIRDIIRELNTWLQSNFPDFRIIASGGRCVEVEPEDA